MPDLIQTQPPESVRLAHQTVSHVCHLLSVPAATQVSTLRTISVSLVKDVPTTDSNTTVFVLTHAQLVPSPQMDTVREDAIQILTFWITSVTIPAHLDSLTEPMSPVLLNVQLDTFLKDQSASYQSKHAHQDNSTTLKPAHVPLVFSRALNVNSPTLTVLSVHLDFPFQTTDVANQTAVDQEGSELHQDHVRHVRQNALIVSAPLNAQLALQVTFLTELTVF